MPAPDPVLDLDPHGPLDALLDADEQAKLLRLASELLGTEVTIRSEPADAGGAVPLGGDWAPQAYLCADSDTTGLAALATLISARLHGERKYRLAASLHAATVAQDYEALQRKHRALIASETRYRRLAAELEKRVAEQVRTINQAERKLYEAEKLASVGQLAAGVAHEINNPVGFVTSNLNMAKQYVERLQHYVDDVEGAVDRTRLPRSHGELLYLFEDFTDLLRESIDGCERVAQIVRNLKDFSNLDGQTRAVVSPNKLVETVCQLFDSQLPVGVALKRQLGDVPAIELNPGMVSQLLSHLLTNAIEAVRAPAGGKPGRIVITTDREPDGVLIKVADNGCGMSTEVQQRAFEPFYTTRAVGSGTGLGLTVCRDVVLGHGGEITLASQPERGTVVSIHLPLRLAVTDE